MALVPPVISALDPLYQVTASVLSSAVAVFWTPIVLAVVAALMEDPEATNQAKGKGWP